MRAISYSVGYTSKMVGDSDTKDKHVSESIQQSVEQMRMKKESEEDVRDAGPAREHIGGMGCEGEQAARRGAGKRIFRHQNGNHQPLDFGGLCFPFCACVCLSRSGIVGGGGRVSEFAL